MPTTSTSLLAYSVCILCGSSGARALALGQSAPSHMAALPSYGLPPDIAYNLGPYSARFPVDHFGNHTAILRDLPSGCDVTQANILQRHGARFPTSDQSRTINETLTKVFQAVSRDPNAIQNTPLAFLSNWSFPVGSDSLLPFGREEAYASGVQTTQTYYRLASAGGVFERATTKARVLEQSRWFRHGFDGGVYPVAGDTLELPDVIIPVGKEQNNTLACARCTADGSGSDDVEISLNPNLLKESSTIGPADQWLKTYAPSIAARLESFVPGLTLSNKEVRFLMALCGFETAYLGGKETSPWCRVFTGNEWAANEYWYDLDKYWNRGHGAPLGPTRGSGWVNELIARLTGEPVHVSGCVNATLDSDPATFPLPPMSPSIFADFSSDDNIAAIIAALGILRDAEPLPPLGPPPPDRLWVTSKLVPFATNLVVEKLSCKSSTGTEGHETVLASEGAFVRIILNDAVVPLVFDRCGRLGISRGMCALGAFVEAQAFSTGGGDWDKLCGL